MRWKNKHKKKPKAGDRKSVHRFAWFPITIDRHTVWLEMYLEVYEYRLRLRTVSLRYYYFEVCAHDWDLIRREVIK